MARSSLLISMGCVLVLAAPAIAQEADEPKTKLRLLESTPSASS